MSKQRLKMAVSLIPKIIDYTVEEKPTGEISAGNGFGTSGEVIEFAVKENNYLGKGIVWMLHFLLGQKE